jgi:thiamine phosphate synthase YjbQ (UPF0047 family)
MRVQNADLVVNTNGKGTYEITDEIQSKIDQSGVRNGTVTVFVQPHQLQFDPNGKCRAGRAP